MDYYKEITSRIEAYYADLKKTNPFYRAIFSGTITPEQLGTYLFNIQYSLKATIPQCKTGAKISKKKGWKKLSQYFQLKIGEEVGHDQWAKEDVERIKERFPGVEIPRHLNKEMQDAIDYNYQLSERDPRLFLVYMLFSEYFTVTAGPECLTALANAGFTRNLISVVDTHVELDREHVHEWGREVKEAGVDFESLHDEVFEVLQRCMDNYGNFWSSVMKTESENGKSKQSIYAA